MQPANTKSVGIIGAGRIGQAMAQVAAMWADAARVGPTPSRRDEGLVIVPRLR
jgi:lactate dehydrogenase-like 2-hydroxyacid dehydrogenase